MSSTSSYRRIGSGTRTPAWKASVRAWYSMSRHEASMSSRPYVVRLPMARLSRLLRVWLRPST